MELTRPCTCMASRCQGQEEISVLRRRAQRLLCRRLKARPRIRQRRAPPRDSRFAAGEVRYSIEQRAIDAARIRASRESRLGTLGEQLVDGIFVALLRIQT